MARCTNFEFFFGPERCERHILYGQIILLFRKIGKLIDCPQISMARRRIFWPFFFLPKNSASPVLCTNWQSAYGLGASPLLICKNFGAARWASSGNQVRIYECFCFSQFSACFSFYRHRHWSHSGFIQNFYDSRWASCFLYGKSDPFVT